VAECIKAGKEHDADKIESDKVIYNIVSSAKPLHVHMTCKYTLQTIQTFPIRDANLIYHNAIMMLRRKGFSTFLDIFDNFHEMFEHLKVKY
jgi:hypothetical protein